MNELMKMIVDVVDLCPGRNHSLHDIDLPRVSTNVLAKNYWREVNCGDTILWLWPAIEGKKCGENGGKRGDQG
jgi:hypothetical protein